MAAYNELYVGDIIEEQGIMFFDIRELFPGIDEKWFIEGFMKSKVRKMLDIAVPKYAGMSGREWAREFLYEIGPSKPEEGIFIEADYKRGETWGGFLPQWVGMIYALYQWKYSIPSEELIKILPLELMHRFYYPFHEAGLDIAAEKIHEIMEGRKV